MTDTDITPTDRRCRHCGATTGLVMLPYGPLSPWQWECTNGCPVPERTAVPGEPLPPLPDSAYPPGAEPLDDGRECGATDGGLARCNKTAGHTGDRHQWNGGFCTYTWGYVPTDEERIEREAHQP